MTDIRLPVLTGGTPEEQLRQIQNYLFSLAGQLQFAFDSISREQERTMKETAVTAKREKTPAEQFAAVKSLIIKSADIVETWSQELEHRLEGQYVAQSQFGSFRQETQQLIRENAEGILQSFRNTQELASRMEGVQSRLLAVDAYIRTGLLYYGEDGIPVYGMEIGQQEDTDGVYRFRRFVRLTSSRLSFYDSNDTEVAYISDYRLHITGAQVQLLTAGEMAASTLCLGDYRWEAAEDGHLTLR